jgi:hypothetical protein
MLPQALTASPDRSNGVTRIMFSFRSLEVGSVGSVSEFTKDGYWCDIQYPRVPGHEVVGIIDKIVSVRWTHVMSVGDGS